MRIRFWVVAIFALVWNGLGCLNLFQQLSSSGLDGFPPNTAPF